MTTNVSEGGERTDRASHTGHASRAELARLGGVLAVVALLGAGRFQNGWVWDDIGMFVRADMVFHGEHALDLFLHDAMYVADRGAFAAVAGLDTYRPLTLLSFMFDGLWGGRRPLPFHVTGLALHLGVVGLIWVLARRLMRAEARPYAWIAAAFVGVHPLLVEAHGWINGRSDTLSTLLVLAAALVWIAPRGAASAAGRSAWRAGLVAVLLLGAALAKEVALFALPALWWLRVEQLRREGERTRLSTVLLQGLVLLPPVALYFALRVHALGGVKASGGEQHVLLSLGRLPHYLLDGLVRLAVPARTAPRFVMEEYASLPQWRFAAAWLVAAVIAGLLARSLRRQRLLCCGALWFACTLGPAVLIASLRWYGFGRYLYLPSTLLAIAVVDFAVDFARRHPLRASVVRWSAVVGGAYALALCLLAARAVADLRDPETFYSAIVRDYPDRSHGYGGAGKLLVERGAYAQGATLLERAISIAPSDANHWNNLAQARLRGGELGAAVDVASRGLARFPQAARLHHVLALARAATDPEGAVRAALDALRLEPSREVTWALLGELITRHPQRVRCRKTLSVELDVPRNAALRPRLSAMLPASGS